MARAGPPCSSVAANRPINSSSSESATARASCTVAESTAGTCTRTRGYWRHAAATTITPTHGTQDAIMVSNVGRRSLKDRYGNHEAVYRQRHDAAAAAYPTRGSTCCATSTNHQKMASNDATWAAPMRSFQDDTLPHPAATMMTATAARYR